MRYMSVTFGPWRCFLAVGLLLALISYQAVHVTDSYFPHYLRPEEGYLSNRIAKTNQSKEIHEILPSRRRNKTHHRRRATDEEARMQENASGPYYVSLQSLNGKLRCWNTEWQCEKLRNQTTDTSREDDITTTSPTGTNLESKRTIALVDPSLRDGYRNQFMRFVAFNAYAVTNGFEQILLPSIRWSCDHRKIGSIAIPFELVFDVAHWNKDPDLPSMVGYDESEHFDWDPFTGLFRGACDLLSAYLYKGPKTKSVLFDQASKYEHPVPYGGGVSLGTLYMEYVHYDTTRPNLRLSRQNASTPFIDLEAKVTRAMKPSATIERLVQKTLGGTDEPPYLVLHARVEPDMLAHSPCKHLKVYNITDVFDMIRGMDHSNMTNLSLFIAINFAEMGVNRYKAFQLEHRLNVAALREAATMGLDLPSGKNLTVSVGGYSAFRDDEIDKCAHEIVSSVVSFEIAIRAKIFIGTYVSSWSATVWKARHYLGRGENYAFTPKGLEKIEGVPKPFRC